MRAEKTIKRQLLSMKSGFKRIHHDKPVLMGEINGLVQGLEWVLGIVEDFNGDVNRWRYESLEEMQKLKRRTK